MRQKARKGALDIGHRSSHGGFGAKLLPSFSNRNFRDLSILTLTLRKRKSGFRNYRRQRNEMMAGLFNIV